LLKQFARRQLGEVFGYENALLPEVEVFRRLFLMVASRSFSLYVSLSPRKSRKYGSRKTISGVRVSSSRSAEFRGDEFVGPAKRSGKKIKRDV
jgi:hypothetical protein